MSRKHKRILFSLFVAFGFAMSLLFLSVDALIKQKVEQALQEYAKTVPYGTVYFEGAIRCIGVKDLMDLAIEQPANTFKGPSQDGVYYLTLVGQPTIRLKQGTDGCTYRIE